MCRKYDYHTGLAYFIHCILYFAAVIATGCSTIAKMALIKVKRDPHARNSSRILNCNRLPQIQQTKLT